MTPNALVTPNQLAKSVIDIRERPMRRMAFSRLQEGRR
jgi:hypothetical protein